jgi:DNA-binding phage protein
MKTEEMKMSLADFKPIDYIKTQEALDAYVDEHTAALREENAEMLAALQGVVRVADRATDEFDAARAAIAKATNSVRH